MPSFNRFANLSHRGVYEYAKTVVMVVIQLSIREPYSRASAMSWN